MTKNGYYFIVKNIRRQHKDYVTLSETNETGILFQHRICMKLETDINILSKTNETGKLIY